VPNTALRFTPAQAGTPAAAASSGGGIVSSLMPRMPRSGTRRNAGGGAAGSRQIWILKDGQAVAMPVTAGISDGRMTEVSAPELKEGLPVITDQRTAGAAP
jgi:HlyD family secretion protein